MRQLSTMQRVRRGALVAVLALVGALVLTGCRSEPGIAAYVGSEKITIDQVEALVDAVDKVNAGRTADVQPGPVPISRQLVLALMVYGDLAHQLVSDRSLTPNPQFVDVVARGYGIPPAHPYAQLLGNYLDSIDILGKNAGTAAPSRDQILRYYRTGVDAQMFPLATPHRIEIGERFFDRRFDAGGELRLGLRVDVAGPLAYGDRLREPQQIARGQRPGHQPLLPRLIERGAEGGDEVEIELHGGRSRRAQLHRNAELDAAAREPFLEHRADPRLQIAERLRQSQLQVEEAMIDGTYGHRD